MVALSFATHVTWQTFRLPHKFCKVCSPNLYIAIDPVVEVRQRRIVMLLESAMARCDAPDNQLVALGLGSFNRMALSVLLSLRGGVDRMGRA
jgi:hypothetical protein